MSNEILLNIMYCTVNVLRVYCFFRFSQFWFKKAKCSFSFELAAYFVYFLLNTVCHILFHNPVINMLTNIIPFFIITFMYPVKKYIGMLATVMIYSVSMITDSIVYAAAQMMGIQSLEITSGMASVILLLCSELMIEKFIQHRRHQKIILKHILSILVVPIGSIIIGMFTMKPENFSSQPEYVAAECFILIAMNTMTFVFYDMTGKIYEQQNIQNALKTQNNAYANQIYLMNTSREHIRYLNHDLKNHFSKIKIMAQNNECDKIIEYVNDAEKYINIPNIYVKSGNLGVDSILNIKLFEANMQNVKIHTEINIPCELKISDFDTNIILGNLLDNSINALSNCTDKRLYIKIKYEIGILYIVVKNTFDENYSENKSVVLDSEHGLGLMSVDNVVKKYSGVLEYYKKNSIFTVNIMMYM